jgi:hypothetical protein
LDAVALFGRGDLQGDQGLFTVLEVFGDVHGFLMNSQVVEGDDL